MLEIQNSHRLTAVVDEQVLDLHAHEDVILQPRDVAVPDVEVPDGVLLLLDHVGIDLEKATNKPWFLFPTILIQTCPGLTPFSKSCPSVSTWSKFKTSTFNKNIG